MKFGYEHEEAVSPVIGVILMVAITVILAATVAMFVFQSANDMGDSKTIGLTVKASGENAVITLTGGDLTKLQYLQVTTGTGSAPKKYWTSSDWKEISSSTAPSGTITAPTVGQKITVDKGSASAVPLQIVGHFTDGSESILWDSTV